VRVAPAAGRAAVVGRHGEGWKVRVAAPPERGRANEAVLRLLADELGTPARSIRVISGQTSRDEVVELRGLDAEEAARRLAGAA
jgi:uncharacterized protein